MTIKTNSYLRLQKSFICETLKTKCQVKDYDIISLVAKAFALLRVSRTTNPLQ
jgi:hypothetical protein